MLSWTEYNSASNIESRLLTLCFILLKKKIANLEDNHDTGAVFLDPAKAFNSISYEIIFNKTKNLSLSLNQKFYSSNLFPQIKNNAKNWVSTR